MAVLLASVSLPVLAVETPKPKSDDELVCTEIYNENQVTAAHLEEGHAVTVEVVPSEKVIKVSVSDSVHLKVSVLPDTNIFWMKPVGMVVSQPLSIVTEREDGSKRVYLQQVDARLPTNMAVASLTSTAMPSAGSKPCYLIRYTDPVEAAAKAAKETQAQHAKRVADWMAIHDAKLLHDHQLTNQNLHYVAKGDRNLAPDRIFDDGYSTFLEFDGNRPVPAPYEVGFKDKDKLLAGWNAEGNACPGGTAPAATCLKLHTVEPKFRLRDREDLAGDKPALTIFNRAFNAIGNRPGTGTSSPDVQREVKQ